MTPLDIFMTTEPRQQLRIHFDFDRSVIRSDALDTLLLAANMLREDPQLEFIIEGHCDHLGSEVYNIELGMRRAESVREFFVERFGFSPARFVLVTRGEAKPIAPNTLPDGADNPEGRAWNRRAEFVR